MILVEILKDKVMSSLVLVEDTRHLFYFEEFSFSMIKDLNDNLKFSCCHF